MLDVLRWKAANWIAGDLIDKCGAESYETGYEHGYQEAEPHKEEFMSWFERGYKAAEHDAE